MVRYTLPVYLQKNFSFIKNLNAMKSKIEFYTIEKVKEFRAKADNMSIRCFADCLNVSHTFILEIEKASTDTAYNLDHLNEIAKILKCSLWDLIPKDPL